jgi:hypothetical protein
LRVCTTCILIICRYLAAIGGLIAGATTAYLPEVGVSLNGLQRDITHLVRRYNEDDRRNIQMKEGLF